uniref:Uncharacterized protein n=1 Tax=Mustela putorius furo TaxID=9669 RepID=M3YND3_MUSPF
MARKSQSPSDSVFQFDIPGSPRKAGSEAPHSSTDSPGSVFLREREQARKGKRSTRQREKQAPH